MTIEVAQAEAPRSAAVVERPVRTPAAKGRSGLLARLGCCAPQQLPLSADDAQRQASVLKALADPHRLRILSLLAAQPAGQPLCVCDLEASFDLSQPTISHHLKVLREAGLVAVTKRGLWHYYATRPEGLAAVRQIVNPLTAGSG